MTTPQRPELDPAPDLLVRLVVRLARSLLPATGAAQDPSALRRVLVVRPDDRVGNALLTIPLARALATLLPQARIDLLLADRRAAVAEGLAGLTVLRFDKRALLRRPLGLVRFLLALRRARYDAALDASHWHAFSLTAALLTRLGSRTQTIGPDRGPTGLYTHKVPLPAPDTPEALAKLALLAPLGLPVPAQAPLETALGATPAAQSRAQRTLEALGLPERFALLNPGARKADHRLAPDVYAALACALHASTGVPVLLTWGPGEEALVAQVHALSQHATQVAPPTDLDALAALLRRCALAITNDTGPMHLAVACGAKVVALFLSADGARWAHPGPRFAAVQAGQGEVVAEAVAGAMRLLA